MVQGNAVGIGQCDAPGACIGGGGVGLAIQADGHGLAICCVGGACHHDVGGHTGGVAQIAALGRIKQGSAVAVAHGVARDVGHGQRGGGGVHGQGACLAAAVVVAVGAADLDGVRLVHQGSQGGCRQGG